MTPSSFSRRDAPKHILFDLNHQGKNFTSGQGHEVTKVGHVAYHPMPLDERNAMRPTTRVYLPSMKSYSQKTIHDLR